MCSDALVNKMMFIGVKCDPGFLEFAKGISGMIFKMCIVNEIQCCADDTDKSRISLASKNTKKNLLHILVFGSSPLRYEGDAFLEVR